MGEAWEHRGAEQAGEVVGVGWGGGTAQVLSMRLPDLALVGARHVNYPVDKEACNRVVPEFDQTWDHSAAAQPWRQSARTGPKP